MTDDNENRYDVPPPGVQHGIDRDGKAVTVIHNGGDPMGDCPRTWSEAKARLDAINEGKPEHGPQWKWDCGFKLDYDVDLIRVSSRFYPPKSHGGPSWDGTVTILFRGREALEKEFDAPTLEVLTEQVEAYVASILDEFDKTLNKLGGCRENDD